MNDDDVQTAFDLEGNTQFMHTSHFISYVFTQ
jgi:hypothetical protein